MIPLNITPVGVVSSVDDEAIIDVDEKYSEHLLRIEERDRLTILYWMHELEPEDRELDQTFPMGDRSAGLWGVFAIRSPMRPNPIGVSEVDLVRREGTRLIVRGLDAWEGSPVIDIKSAPRP